MLQIKKCDTLLVKCDTSCILCRTKCDTLLFPYFYHWFVVMCKLVLLPSAEQNYVPLQQNRVDAEFGKFKFDSQVVVI